MEGGPLPYRPEALAKKKENFAKRLTRPTSRELNETTGDPEAKCYLPGVPRATYMPFPFQIVQTPQQILIAYEFANATRQIHIGRKPEAPAAIVDGLVDWPLGGRDAGRRRHRSGRARHGSTGPGISTAMRCTWSNDTRPRVPIT